MGCPIRLHDPRSDGTGQGKLPSCPTEQLSSRLLRIAGRGRFEAGLRPGERPAAIHANPDLPCRPIVLRRRLNLRVQDHCLDQNPLWWLGELVQDRASEQRVCKWPKPFSRRPPSRMSSTNRPPCRGLLAPLASSRGLGRCRNGPAPGPTADLRCGSLQSGGVTCGPERFGFGHQGGRPWNTMSGSMCRWS